MLGKKILVVDDSLTVRQELDGVLSEAGFSVVEAVDGQHGLEQLGAHKDVALVISDVHMPRMTGVQLLEAMKSKMDTSHIPVVMLTTEGLPTMIQAARKAGAAGWMVKPFKRHMLLAAVQKIMGC